MATVLERIYIHNYKCLVGFDLSLQETVLLLGRNGAGKTAVLDAMFGLRELLSARAKITDWDAFHPSTLTRWQPESCQVFELNAAADGDRFCYRLKIEHDTDRRQSRVVEESLTAAQTPLFQCHLGEVQLYRDDGSEGPSYRTDWSESALARVVPQASNTRLTAFMDAIRATVVCTIRPALLRAESTGEVALLDRYAENFVDWYRHVVQENPTSSSGHVNALKAVIEGFTNIHLQRSGLDSRALMLDFVDGDGYLGGGNNLATATGRGERHYRLRFDELSDGQRVLVVLYALLHLRQPDRGVVLFLDEPDNYLALPEIQPWLIELVELCEETPSQAVMCSHHPELVDYLGPDCGLLLRRGESAVTAVQPAASLDADASLKISELIARGWDS